MRSTEDHDVTAAPGAVSDQEWRRAEESCDLPVAPWHPGWTGRHLLVTATASMAAWFFFADLWIGAFGLGRPVVLGLLSAASGLVVASYLPRASVRVRPPRDVCGYAPLLMLLAAGFFLTVAGGSLWGAFPALVLAAAAVLRRTTGSSTCSV